MSGDGPSLLSSINSNWMGIITPNISRLPDVNITPPMANAIKEGEKNSENEVFMDGNDQGSIVENDSNTKEVA